MRVLETERLVREHVNFARTHELLNSGRINENRGRNQSLLNNETKQSQDLRNWHSAIAIL